MTSVLTQPYFNDEAAAFAALEAILWPNGTTCPHCGATDRINRLEGVKDKKGRVRLGLWKCYHCRGQFTVRKGTVFEASHLKLHQWFQAAYLLCSSKKGVSSNQLARTLGCTVKTAWFASHRIREAMKDAKIAPLGGKGKFVEADETFFGRRKGFTKRRGFAHTMKVMSLVERGGDVRSTVLESITRTDVEQIIRENVHPKSTLMTDTAPYYKRSKLGTDKHKMVNHYANEYVRGDAHVNTLEGYFSVFKRGMKGVYQHCQEKHLHRYLAEFDFRYNARMALGINDAARTTKALLGARGKRLTYRDSSWA
ncbi:MAG TPA: IS1595 family transposase [Candidatus Eremiobacteraceae bacterium]|nr:IS1595 family transposase [Candidatus Eremiobacteraceae bacterium]